MNTFWKRNSLLILGSAFLFCFPVALTNYIVDPFWCFQHTVPVGQFQRGFDERQQKTNYLAFRKTDFDTVIIGNSRVAYMNPLAVPGKAYNYAANAMRSYEFLPYLQFAASHSSHPIQTVVLGLSFVDANATRRPPYDPPEEYIGRAESWGFRYKSLLNIRLLRHSIDSVKRGLQANYHDAYVREGIEMPVKRMMLPLSPLAHRKAIDKQLLFFRSVKYGKDYVYLDKRPVYMELKKHFPATHFMVFTTPVSAHLLKLLVEQELFDHYARWISDNVETFGEIWNFMYFNAITTDDNNYKDADHYSPQVCDMITRKLYGLAGESENKDFGIKVTRENLKEHLNFLRQNMLIR